ncbi:hypothetical protein [Draconibacterium orientale]|uniref:hypothetical protein n=1 Tax=Draconibacterium orientale TaxID=1168034 RepID=UPI0029C02391|nr:hypothetical protein [Draconibacterium orientale]
MNQNPFNLYDFLGYLIPGILFLNLFKLTGFYEVDLFNLLKIGELDWVYYTTLIVIAYVSGHILAIISSRTIEDYHIWLNGYPSKNIFVENHDKGKVRLYLGLVLILIFPIFIIDRVSRFMFNYSSKTLDSSLNKIVLKKLVLFFKKIDKKASNEIRTSKYLCNELFRYIYHYANENFKEHNSKFQNYVALYGFSRSMSFLFCLLVDLELIFVFYRIVKCEKIPSSNLALLFISLIGGYIFYLSYAKFFRRFSQEVIMAFAANYEIGKRKSETQP